MLSNLAEARCLLLALSPNPSDNDVAWLRDTLQHDVDPASLIEIALRHGVTGLLHRGLREHCADLLTGDIEDALSLFQSGQAERNEALSVELARVTAALEQADIEALSFKGPALAMQAYDDPALRFSRHLDLLIHWHDRARTADILHKLGYRRIAAWRHHALQRCEGYERFANQNADIALEIRWTFFPNTFALDVDYDGLWDRSQQLAVSGGAVRCLSKEDMFSTACLLGAKEQWWRLNWICDIAGYLTVSPDRAPSWPTLLDRARSQRCLRAVLVGASLANRLLGVELPADMRLAIAADPHVESMRNTVTLEKVNLGNPNSINSFGRFERFHYDMHEGVWRKISYMLRTLCAPRPKHIRRLALPPSIQALYFVLRPAQDYLLAPAWHLARSLAAPQRSRAKLPQRLRRFVQISRLRAAARRNSSDHRVLDALGTLQIESGSFARAARSVLKSHTLEPRNPDACTIMSALFNKVGDSVSSRRCLIDAVRLRPISGPAEPDPSKPTLLRFRTVETSFSTIHWNPAASRHEPFRANAGFITKDLVDEPKWNLYEADVYREDLLHQEKIPHIDVALNTICVAELSSVELNMVSRIVDRWNIKTFINDPRQVLKTTRGNNYRRLNGIDGLQFPQTLSLQNDFSSPAALAQRLEQLGFTYPLLLRPSGTHTGISFFKVDNENALSEPFNVLQDSAEIYAIQFTDLSDQHGLYHKMRAFFIDGRLYPVARLTSDSWQIHSEDRYRIMGTNKATQIEEQHYLNDPESFLGPDNLKRLYEIHEIIGLDFFGVDFCLKADGSIFVFEANPSMRHNFDHAGNFPYTRPHLEQVSAAFQRMLEDRLERS